MELQQDERRALIALALEKSDENIQAAKCLLNNEIPSKAASASYYSAFHSMHALFLQYQLVQTKRRGHRSGIDLFHKNFVHTGVFSSEIGKIVGQLEWLRNTGDYSIEKTVTRNDAVKAIADAEKFNTAIRTHIQEQQQKENRQVVKQTQETAEQIPQLNKADLNELEAATALLKNPRALDNATFRGHVIPPQQNDTLDLLEQVRSYIQKNQSTLISLEKSGLTLDSIAKNKIVRAGQFPNLRDANVLARTKDSLILIKGRSLYIYELKKLELKAPAQGVPGEKLDLKWIDGQEKAQASHSQERKLQQQYGRRQSRGQEQ